MFRELFAFGLLSLLVKITTATHGDPSSSAVLNHGSSLDHETTNTYKSSDATSHKNPNCTCVTDSHKDSESHSGEHREDEHHEEEHHVSKHAVIWPSAVAMLIFIAISGYAFFYFYSREKVREIIRIEETRLLEEAIIATTTAGAAVPALIGFGVCTFEKSPPTSGSRSFSRDFKHKSVKKMFRHLSTKNFSLEEF